MALSGVWEDAGHGYKHNVTISLEVLVRMRISDLPIWDHIPTDIRAAKD
jgi:hypothetical protein